MKAVVCQKTELNVADVPQPVPGRGQVLLKVLRCGICGSDLHLRHHCDHMGAMIARAGYPTFPTSRDAVVFGHEFCGEVLEHGPGCRATEKAGTRVCALPLLRQSKGVDLIGLSAQSAGAYAEQIVVEEALMMPVPNGLPSDHAALTEPMAVALHAVRRSQIKRGEVAVVIGCGPVGLAVIAMLRARGAKTIIASDFSPGRRALATRCGADVVIDPGKESPYAGMRDLGMATGLPEMLELAVGTREKLGRLPIPWWHTWRAAEAAGLTPKRPVVFECVGVPGILQSILDGAPLLSRVIVVGVCMQADSIEPAMAINKEIELRFVLGYTPLEYRDALHMLADGKVDATPLITGVVGLQGVDAAFTALRDPEVHAKILIDPAQAGSSILGPR